MTNVRHPVVILKAKKQIPGLIVQAKTISAAIAANATLFPTPSLPLSQLNNDVAALELAQTQAKSRTVGAVQARDLKAKAVGDDLKAILAYVQSLINASPAQAAAYATAASLALKTVTPQKLAPLVATLALASGSVDLVAHKFASKAQTVFHEWQSSLDGGKTWVAGQPTKLAHTTLTGFPVLTTVSFRHRVNSSKGPAEWSQAVSIIVH
jgi:hypothetical protein